MLNQDPLWYKDAIFYELRVGAFSDMTVSGVSVTGTDGSNFSVAPDQCNGVAVGAEAIQIFTRNQMQWRCRPLGEDEAPDGVCVDASGAVATLNQRIQRYPDDQRKTVKKLLKKAQKDGMPAVALTPKAGAHGELCGLLGWDVGDDQSARACLTCDTHLSEDLAFAGDHRVEPGGDAEEVARGVVAAKPVERRAELRLEGE